MFPLAFVDLCSMGLDKLGKTMGELNLIFMIKIVKVILKSVFERLLEKPKRGNALVSNESWIWSCIPAGFMIRLRG